MEKENPTYYSVIPANVRYDKNLTANAKLLFAEITSLTSKEGYCWATNAYFASLYGVTERVISKWISSLVENGYLINKLVYKKGTKSVEQRILTIVNPPEQMFTPSRTNVHHPPEQMFQDNNTSNNIKYEYNTSEQARNDDSNLIPLVIKEMEVVDPKNKRFYSNKTQREACRFLIETYTFDVVIKVIKALPTMKSTVPFFPSITTPCELRDKWSKMKDAIDREKLKKKPPIVLFT